MIRLTVVATPFPTVVTIANWLRAMPKDNFERAWLDLLLQRFG